MKLNLGGGFQKIPGFLNVDRVIGRDAYPLPDYPDGSVSEIRASHLLEHFGHRESLAVLREWVRVLEPGGVLRVAVPDFDYVVQHREDEIPIESYLMGGQANDDDFHKSIWNYNKLRSQMMAAGLVEITRWTSEINDCASYPVSLNLQGKKPLVGDVAKINDSERVEVNAKVVAVMSVPRLGWNDHWGAAWQGLRTAEYEIPLWKFGGAFWEQGIQNALVKAVDKGIDWVITLDYDTLFAPEDVKELLSLAALYPHADAIVPVQVRRNNEQFMFSMHDTSGSMRRSVDFEELEADLTPIETGHFGMTLIKLAALKDIAKPWLWSQPDADGNWSDERTDADIYFWRKFRAAGRKVYQANHIKLGHIQVTSAWPTTNWEIKHQYLSDWTSNGKPKECIPDED